MTAQTSRTFSFLQQRHRALVLLGVAMALLALLFAILIFGDGRTIGGQPAWLKPTKFAVSISLYSLTLAWLLGFVNTRRRWRGALAAGAGWVIALALVAEMVAIVLQVLRGVHSHFNVATPFDAFWWTVMAVAIMILWGAHLLVTLLLLSQRLERPAFAWSLRLGLLLTLVGMALGFLMTSPTAQQRALWARGSPTTIVGAHSVGVSDGGPGLPVLGWSTQGGDLRVGHFVGMHALQVLPLVGWLVSRRRLREGQKLGLVWTAGLGYLGLMGLVTAQALRAQPLLGADAATLGGLGLLLALVGAGAALFGRGGAAGARPPRARQ